MFLKKVDMKGFKSFADTIALEFDHCITSIIGPNGSGKSNIADAVKWVMGEQSLKNLRGTKSSDIIFSGTQSRRALSYAEVSLVLDNEDRELPIEYDEVSISRRLYRSGESEYIINAQKCRLKDVYALLMDTGIGKSGYAVVGQGQVEELLSHKSEERRSIFDQAAGIGKHKVKKAEALKKLEKTEANMMRVSDIIVEIESSLEQLEKKAEKARKYLQLQSELKTMEVHMFCAFIDEIEKKRSDIEKQISSVVKERKKEEEKMASKQAGIEASEAAMERLDEKLQKIAADERYAQDGIHQKKADVRVELERLHRKVLDMKDCEDRIKSHIREHKQRKIDLSRINEDIKKYQKDLLFQEEQKKKHRSLLDELNRDLDEHERSIDQWKMDVMQYMEKMADHKSDVVRTSNMCDDLQKQMQRLKRDIEENEKDRSAVSSGMQQAQKKLEQLETKEQQTDERIRSLITSINEHTQRFSKLERDMAKNESDLKLEKSKASMIRQMEQAHEGYAKSVKTLLQACDTQLKTRVRCHGTVASLIRTKKQYETAIEVALGGAMQFVVTDDEQDVKTMIDYLRSGRHGRVTFLPLSNIRPRALNRKVAIICDGFDGYIDTADSLVAYDPLYENVIKNLLGRILIAKDYDCAMDLAKKIGFSDRIVTLQGDVIHPGGSITGGSSNTHSAGLLSRNRVLLEAEAKIQQLTKDGQSIRKNIDDEKQVLKNMEEQRETSAEMKRGLEHARIRVENELASLQEKEETMLQKKDYEQQELIRLDSEKQQAEKQFEQAQQSLLTLQKKADEAKNHIRIQESSHKEEQKEKERLIEASNDAAMACNTLHQRLDAAKRRKKEWDERLHEVWTSLNDEFAAIKSYRNHIQQMNEDLYEMQETLDALMKKVKGSRVAVTSMEEQKKDRKRQNQEDRRSIDEANRHILRLKEEENRLFYRKEKIDTDASNWKERMWNEYELSYAEALNMTKNQDTPSEKPTAAAISNLKKKMASMGSVDVTAISEYTQTKERYDFLKKQKNELESAKEKLKQVVYEMNAVMKSKFMERFDTINQNFKKVFDALFEGGKAELVLADEANILESDVEVFVQPPGKNLQNMMLLSGGERALSAIALLFSIMQLKPPPFCILDEIEATLDDVNVYRFMDYLRTLSKQTQFVLITHRKGTMESSDALYGVTMQEHGVSKIVSLDMDKTG